MVGVILLSRRCNINPDNVATPIAASLGDLTTLGLLSWIASVLFASKSEQIQLAHLRQSLVFFYDFTFVFFFFFRYLQFPSLTVFPSCSDQSVAECGHRDWLPAVAAAVGVALQQEPLHEGGPLLGMDARHLGNDDLQVN